LKSEFNGDHRSRFIIGYIPSFSKQKSSADQRRRAGTQKVLDPAFAITTSVFQSLQPLVKAQMDPPSGCATWGSNQASAVLVMGAVLGDGKAMTCCVPGDVLVPNHASVPSYVYPSAVASDTTQLFHWINSAVIDESRAAMFDVSDTQRSEWNRHLHYLPTKQGRRNTAVPPGVESQLKSYGRPLEVMRYIMLSLMSISFLWRCLRPHVS
jgi:hypothetical protein